MKECSLCHVPIDKFAIKVAQNFEVCESCYSDGSVCAKFGHDFQVLFDREIDEISCNRCGTSQLDAVTNGEIDARRS